MSKQDDRVRRIIDEVLENRAKGRVITDAEVCAAHPDLHDQLVFQLRIADQIRKAMLAARKAPAKLEKLRDISESELDQCIEELRNDLGRRFRREEVTPRIAGYALKSEVNRGGQAVIYEAIQESTGRKVAIKLMFGGSFAGPLHRERFDREARILAALDHPNIVSIIERGRTPDGSFFLIMPFIDGYSLDDYWNTALTNNRAGLRALIAIFARITEAVELAHQSKVVHRDLKPSNIRVDQRGVPHVLDFGLARPMEKAADIAARTITGPGQIVGSLPWASPEQAAGQSAELTPPSDVYSLGVILYQSLTSSFPYSLEGPIDEVVSRIRTLRPVAPSKHAKCRAGVDRRLDAIVLKSLSKDPQDRYPTAGGLLNDLEAWLAGRSPMAARPQPHPRRSAMIAAAFISIFLIASALLYKFKQPEAVSVIDLPSLRNDVGMTLVKIPVGIVLMGSPISEAGRKSDEHQHTVAIDHPFLISTTAVTQSQYEKVMHTNPSDQRWRGNEYPVGNVSWIEAAAYCHLLSDREHAHYRLPSEAEWEYVCRAGSLGPFPDPSHPEKTAFTLASSGKAIHRVAQKQPNVWGLFDMQGNIQQWCDDVYYPDPTDHLGTPLKLNWRVLRGGSALCDTVNCRAASRAYRSETTHQPDVGFRVVCDP